MTDVPLDLLDPDYVKGPVEGRACTDIDCALCCKLVSIDWPDGTKKPAGEWCAHCTPPACKIYPDRPQVCRTYFCTWLGDAWWPEELNPVKTGALVMTERVVGSNTKTGKKFSIAVVRVHESRPGATENIERALRAVWDLGCAICIYTTNGRLRLVGFAETGARERITFAEKMAALTGKNPMPTVTRQTLRNWGGDWRALAKDCARVIKEKDEADARK